MKERDSVSFQWCPVTRGSRHKLKRESLAEDTKRPFYYEGGQIQEQGAQRSAQSQLQLWRYSKPTALVCLFQVILLEQDWTR